MLQSPRIRVSFSGILGGYSPDVDLELTCSVELLTKWEELFTSYARHSYEKVAGVLAGRLFRRRTTPPGLAQGS